VWIIWWSLVVVVGAKIGEAVVVLEASSQEHRFR
jgi:hypothetical protein